MWNENEASGASVVLSGELSAEAAPQRPGDESANHGTGGAADIAGRACWYCGKPAVSIWRTTWDAPGEDWPMCSGCGDGVAARLCLRAVGAQADADAGDDDAGIDTRGLAGRWISPKDLLPGGRTFGWGG